MYSCVNPALITLLCALEKLVTVNDPPSTIHLCEWCKLQLKKPEWHNAYKLVKLVRHWKKTPNIQNIKTKFAAAGFQIMQYN